MRHCLPTARVLWSAGLAWGPLAPPIKRRQGLTRARRVRVRPIDKGPAYPVSIRNAIQARTQRSVSRAAVFITLERLESKGFVTSRYGDPTPVRSGRAKRFFRETPAGVAAAKEAIQMMRSMTEGLGEVLE